MKSKQPILIFLLAALVLLASCGTTQEPTKIANPASEYCTQHGGTLKLVTDEQASHGECHFPDGSVCEEWAFFRGECQPGTNP